LPIELISFLGERKNENTVRLTWILANADEITSWELQRSENGCYFNSIQQGKTSHHSAFEHLDQEAYSEILYYRLKFYYSNRTYEYSDIISVQNKSDSGIEVVYLSQELKYKLDTTEAKVSLLDFTGRTVWNTSFTPTALYMLPEALYILQKCPTLPDVAESPHKSVHYE